MRSLYVSREHQKSIIRQRLVASPGELIERINGWTEALKSVHDENGQTQVQMKIADYKEVLQSLGVEPKKGKKNGKAKADVSG